MAVATRRKKSKGRTRVRAKARAEKKLCAVLHCPPIETKSHLFVGMTIKAIREATDQVENLEIPENATVSVSKDGGEHYKRVDDDYVVQDKDHVEFGRPSSRKG